MIEFGKKVTKVFKTGKQPVIEQIMGYYLVYKGNRYFISENVCEYSLNKVCNRVMPADSDNKSDYEYWVDYCMGYDVNGNLAWVNIDQTDKFI